MDDVIVDMRNISKTFSGIKALDNVQLTLRRGQVHALMGENGAGKSTLMKILTGIHSSDSGEIWLNTSDKHLNKVEVKTPLEAQSLGIGMVFQELNLLSNMTVAENIFLGREPLTKWKTIDQKKLGILAKEELNKVNLDIDPKSLIENLSVGQNQLIEIAKCLSLNARVIVLDEPTASLTDKEASVLFELIKELKKQEVSIVYISHRMEEVFELADQISIFRDGKYIDTIDRCYFNEEKIIKKMIGRELNLNRNNLSNRKISKDEILSVENISIYPSSKPISFGLKKGEILGFFGLVGAGRTELSEMLFGVRPLRSGKIFISGEEVIIKNPNDSIQAGVGLVPEDRKGLGLILGMSVKDNMLISKLTILKQEILNNRILNQLSSNYQEKLGIVMSNSEQQVKDLSGGNQQKVVIAKWLAMHPKILILDEPTRGIDIGAKSEIYKLIKELADEGMSIIMISSEMNEILNISDRIIVMKEGSLMKEIPIDLANQENIMTAAIGG